MFSWFKKSVPRSAPPWGIHVDIHNHVLPGIDDGAQDLEQSAFLLKGLADLGFHEIIATPHTAAGIYLNNPASIAAAFEAVQSSAISEKKNLKSFASEYMMDDYFDRLIPLGLLCLPNRANHRYVLVELPYMDLPYHWHDSIFALRKAGYIPILAHPERYAYIKPSIMLERFRATGILFQLNLLSLGGYYGRSVMQVAQCYMREGLYDFAGTDVHHDNHILGLQRMAKDVELSIQIAEYPFKNNSVFGMNN
jgi:tyrosine-protein phosphatase YwqE